jgi:DNA-binding NarL/FixJ family response regulator
MTKILLVDDHPVVRYGLRSLLEQEKDMTVVGEAGDGRTAIEMAKQLRPDVVLMDVSLPRVNGQEATRAILEILPGVRVIALTVNSDARSVKDMLLAGVSGYVLKECAGRELMGAIHAVLAGNQYLSAGITSHVVSAYKHAAGVEPAEIACLTPTELKVLRMLVEGQSNKEIAVSLDVNVKSVENYRASVMKKLDLHSIVELTKFAIRKGVISLDK